MKKDVIDGMLASLEQVYPGASTRIKIAELGSPASQTRFTTAGAVLGRNLVREVRAGVIIADRNRIHDWDAAGGC